MKINDCINKVLQSCMSNCNKKKTAEEVTESLECNFCDVPYIILHLQKKRRNKMNKINLNFDEEANHFEGEGLSDEILNTLLDKVAKYTVEQNMKKFQGELPCDDTDDYEGISISEAIYDYYQGRTDRKKQEEHDKEVLISIVAGRLDIPLYSVSIVDGDIVIDMTKID